MGVAVQAGDAPGGAVPPQLTGLIARAVTATLNAEQIPDAEISVTLLGDEAIAALNARWLDHDGPTDVLAFPLYAAGESPVGDVYIGVEQAAGQAAALGVPLAEELVRLAIHGTLHVLGHDHEEDETRVESAMWRAQERLVAEVMAS